MHGNPIYPICPICSAKMVFAGLKASGNPVALAGGMYYEWICEKCGHTERVWILHW